MQTKLQKTGRGAESQKLLPKKLKIRLIKIRRIGFSNSVTVRIRFHKKQKLAKSLGFELLRASTTMHVLFSLFRQNL